MGKVDGKNIAKNNIKISGKTRFIILFVALLVICVLYSVKSAVTLDSGKKSYINITAGESTTDIADDLRGKGIIKSTLAFKIFSKYYNYDGKYKTGSFLVNTDNGYEGIMKILSGNNTNSGLIKVTFPEGFTVKEIASRLSQMGLANYDKFLKAANGNYDYPFLSVDNKSAFKLEGYLFPDTYFFKRGQSEDDTVKMMLDRFNAVFKKEYYEKAKKVNLSIKELMTMASIVEREAKLQSERPLIAGVFYNRINRKMKLQACSTVQYVMDEHKDILSNKDIAIDSPYNTYKYEGLPPGPICNPGIKSIEASLSPHKSGYLYFVAKGNGAHYFSSTYKEHIKAVSVYEKR